MNERINDLILQAGFEPHYEPDGTFSYSEQFEKFAELIVAECMEQVWFSRVTTPIGNISEVIKERMKQHFGVES